MAFSFEYPPKPSTVAQEKINIFQYEAIGVRIRMSERNPRWTGDMTKADDEAKRELNELSMAHLGYASPHITP